VQVRRPYTGDGLVHAKGSALASRIEVMGGRQTQVSVRVHTPEHAKVLMDAHTHTHIHKHKHKLRHKHKHKHTRSQASEARAVASVKDYMRNGGGASSGDGDGNSGDGGGYKGEHHAESREYEMKSRRVPR
jgi:hypothetical protein